MLDWCASASTRAATTSGIVPGLSAAPSSSLSSWRAVASSSCFRFFSSALVFSMMSFEPASAASALSAPVRWPVCSGVTSVSDVQSARLALTATGPSRLVTVARNASASFSVAESADFLDGLAGFGSSADGFAAACAATPVATTAAPTQATTQATRGRAHRIEARMPGTYLKVSAIDSQVGAW